MFTSFPVDAAKVYEHKHPLPGPGLAGGLEVVVGAGSGPERKSFAWSVQNKSARQAAPHAIY